MADRPSDANLNKFSVLSQPGDSAAQDADSTTHQSQQQGRAAVSDGPLPGGAAPVQQMDAATATPNGSSCGGTGGGGNSEAGAAVSGSSIARPPHGLLKPCLTRTTLNFWEEGSISGFPEFGLSADEVTTAEERLHSTDETFGALNHGKETDPKVEVVLQLEMTPRALVKHIYNVTKLLILVSIIALGLIFSAKLSDDKFAMFDMWFEWVNIAFSSVSCLASLAVFGQFVRRLIAVKRKGLKWSARRWRLSMENFLQVSSMVVVNVFWLAPNVYLVARNCSWFANFITWSAFFRWSGLFLNLSLFVLRALDFNFQSKPHRSKGFTANDPGAAVHEDQEVMLLDKGWVMYSIVGLLWLPPTGFLLLHTIRDQLDNYTNKWLDNPDSCNSPEANYDCKESMYRTWAVMLYSSFIPLYFLLYFALILRGALYLRGRPYANYRTANTLLRMTFRQNLSTFLVLMLSQVLLAMVQPTSCASRMVSWATGLMPTNLVMNGTILLPALLFMPSYPSEQSAERFRAKERLGRFAWMERDKARALAKAREEEADRARQQLHQGGGSGSDSGSSRASGRLHRALRGADAPHSRQYPFCFETTLKCLYFNWCAYMHQLNQDGLADWGGVDILTAMAMYGCTGYEIVYEPKTSAKAVVAWGRQTVVLAFRGTVSIRGCYQNLKLWTRPHPPKRRLPFSSGALLSREPRVQGGFLNCWLAGGFNNRVLEVLQRAVAGGGGATAGGAAGSGYTVTVTGHSQGAAMAMLAAYDLQGEGWDFNHVQCYTLGCPHVGNKAFALDYSSRVPDTWNIVNDQDAVVRSGKVSSLLIRMLERPGTKVLVNNRGDMLCAPSAIEAYLNLVPGCASWDDHLLSSYDEVITEVCRQQFTSKGLRGGLLGMLSILQNSTLRRHYAKKGLDVYQEVEAIREGLMYKDGGEDDKPNVGVRNSLNSAIALGSSYVAAATSQLVGKKRRGSAELKRGGQQAGQAAGPAAGGSDIDLERQQWQGGEEGEGDEEAQVDRLRR